MPRRWSWVLLFSLRSVTLHGSPLCFYLHLTRSFTLPGWSVTTNLPKTDALDANNENILMNMHSSGLTTLEMIPAGSYLLNSAVKIRPAHP